MQTPNTTDSDSAVNETTAQQAKKTKGSRTVKKQAAPKAKGATKQSRVLAMLQASSGTTIAAMMKATGWQQHSVRGFLSAVVRTKLRLNLTSEMTDGKRTYRMGGGSVKRTTVKSRRKLLARPQNSFVSAISGLELLLSVIAAEGTLARERRSWKNFLAVLRLQ